MRDKEIRCFATVDEFHALHRAIDKARSNTQNIKVPKQALLNVLMDHSAFYDTLQKAGYSLSEPEP